MKLLYVCDLDRGGIAEYAIRQFNALRELGIVADFLCRPSFDTSRLVQEAVFPLLPRQSRRSWKPLRIAAQLVDAILVARIAARVAKERNCDGILFACYREYFAPFWAGILRRAARRGLVIGTIAHDPVRDLCLGPAWWHQWSVREGYSFVRHIFVHDETPVDFGGGQPDVQVHQIPHGPFIVPFSNADRELTRRRYAFEEGDTVLLSFGHIRDGKNLSLILDAMTKMPASVKLLVAGKNAATSQLGAEHYRDLAKKLGLEARCVWDLRYIPEAEVGSIFAASDAVLLTYDKHFRSASGVFNLAVGCRKLVVASAGPSPLETAVESYDVGIFVPPDDANAIAEGVRKLLTEPPSPRWDKYEEENSWKKNARGIVQAFGKDS